MWESRSDFQGLWEAVFAFHQSVISTGRCLFDRGFCFRFLSLLNTIARDVQLEDDAVVHQAVNGRSRRHRVFENAFPFGKRQIAGDQNAAAFVAFCQEGEQHFHLFTALLDIAEVIDNEPFECSQALDESAELEISFGNQQVLHEQS